MNKSFKLLICLLLLRGTTLISPTKVSTYEVKDDYNISVVKNGKVCSDGDCIESRSYYDPCDQIFRVGEFATFQLGGSINYFRVDGVDAASDKVYSSELSAWIPAYPLLEVTPGIGTSGDQIFRVGEYFAVIGDGDGIYGAYTILNVDAQTNSVLINFKNVWGNWEATWVNAGPLIEYGCPNIQY